MLINKYEIIGNISKGEFGEVLKVSYNNKHYALKYGAKEVIKYEIQIYKQLKSISNISNIYDVFETGNNMYMVLDLYMMTLVDYKLQNHEHINYSITCITIIKDLITIIKSVHDNNIVHRDLKPTNICMDCNNKLHLIDFGISKIYKQNNVHIKEAKIHSVIGSVNFSSLNVINLIEPSRRDDMESILYILFYLLINNISYISYNNLNIYEKKNIDTILMFLQDNTSITLNNCINFMNVEKIFKYIRRLKYNQEPNYDYIIKLL